MVNKERARTLRRATERANKQRNKGRSSRRTSKSDVVIWVAAGVVAVLVIVAVVMVIKPWEERIDPNEVQVLDETTHVLDDAGPDAPVLVEFLDFECEACGYYYPAIEEMREKYNGQFTYAFRHLPGHNNSVNAALAVEAAAQQDRLEDMFNLVFERQKEWAERAEADPSIFRAFAEELGLDMAAYDAAVADPATMERITSDQAAARSLGVSSTPSFFLNGELIRPQGPEELEEAIQAAIEEGPAG